MPLRPNFGAAVLILGTLLLAGCGAATVRNGTTAKVASAAHATAEAAAPAVDTSPEALELQAEAHAHYAMAVIHDLDDQPQQANEELCQAAFCDLSNEPLILEVVRRLIQFKQYDRAAELAAKAAALPNASGMIFARLGLVYSLLGKNDEAIAASQKAVQKLPDSIAGYQNLARIYLQTGRHEAGLKILDQAAKVPGVDAAFLVDLSELYNAFSRAGVSTNLSAKPLAVEMLNRAAKLNPTNPMLLQKLADGFVMLNEGEKAAGIYQKLLERFPNLPGLREKLAEIYLRRKDRDKAVEQLEAIKRQNPTNPQVYYLLGSAAFDARKMEEAAKNFHEALLLNDELEPAYYDLSLAQINLKQSRKALETLGRAREKFPRAFAGEFFTGIAYASLKEYSNAINHFIAAEVIGRATDTNRLTHFFYFQLGAAYERNQQLEEAEINLTKAVRLSPDFAEGLNYLGYMWADRGTNLVQARECIEKALKLEPENGAFLDSLAWVFYKLKQPGEALTRQLKAIELTKEPDATLFDHLGDIYAAMDQRDKAVEAWRKALALEPSPEIQKKLQPVAGGALPARQP